MLATKRRETTESAAFYSSSLSPLHPPSPGQNDCGDEVPDEAPERHDALDHALQPEGELQVGRKKKCTVRSAQ